MLCENFSSLYCGCGGIGRRAGFRCQSSQGGMGSSPFIRTKRRKIEPPDAVVFLQKSSCRGVQICENKVKQKARFGRPRRTFCVILLLCVGDICGELRVLFPPFLCIGKDALDQLFNLCCRNEQPDHCRDFGV